MADVLISDLTVASPLVASDLLELEQGVSPANASTKVTLSALASYFNSSPNTLVALTPVAGVVTLNLNGGLSRNFTLTLAVNVTSLVFSNLPAVGFAAEFELEIKQDGTGGRTFSLPASFRALGGSDTSISLTANSVTVLSAKTFDQGATWRYAMQESA